MLAAAESEGFRARWTDVQTGFVDAPRRAVEQADALVAELMQHLAKSFADERGRLEGQWDRGEDIPTDDLRTAFQRYRSFFERLLVDLTHPHPGPAAFAEEGGRAARCPANGRAAMSSTGSRLRSPGEVPQWHHRRGGSDVTRYLLAVDFQPGVVDTPMSEWKPEEITAHLDYYEALQRRAGRERRAGRLARC